MTSEAELCGSAAKLYHIIEKIVVTHGLLDTDPVIWQFYILGKILKVPVEKLSSQKTFKEQYLRAFNCQAPKLSSDDWSELLGVFDDEKCGKKEVIDDAEESENVFMARQVFAYIKKLPIETDDENSTLQGKCLLQKGDTCVLIATKIEEIVKELNYNIIANRLSPVMTQLKMKTAGTEDMRLEGKHVRVWKFYTAQLENF